MDSIDPEQLAGHWKRVFSRHPRLLAIHAKLLAPCSKMYELS